MQVNKMDWPEKKIKELRVLLKTFEPKGKTIPELLGFCREVVDLWKLAELPETDIFLWFLAIDDDADRFPVGRQRQFWNKAAMKKLDEEAEKVFSRIPGEINRKTKLLLNELESSNF